MYNALVTGASGFIGSHLAEFLVKKGWSVTCLLRPTSRRNRLQGLSVKFAVGDPEDKTFLEKSATGQDYVFHVAGRIRSASKEIYDRSNHLFTRNLSRACAEKAPKLKRFVYVSSISAAGPSPPGETADESFPPSPNSEYGRSKRRGETALEELRGILSYTIIRPPNVYGPGQQETEMLIKIVQKRIVPVLKSLKKKTSLIHSGDLVRGITEAAVHSRTRDRVYYLTDGRQYSWRELILTVKDIVLGDGLFFPLKEPLILAAAGGADLLKKTGMFSTMFGLRAWKTITETPWLFSSARAEKDFGFRAEYDLVQGLKQTVFFRD